ncbi:ATPase, partial [Mycobacterium avium subsp. hominissuis]
MSEHPTAGVGAPEEQTTQIPPAAAAGDEKKDAAEPQPEPGGEAPTKAFAGFRT